MCGIVGIVSKQEFGFYGSHDDQFEELLYADGLRGMDSTGVFIVTKKHQVDVLKQAVNPGIFVQTESWKTMKRTINSKARIVIGHNRKATHGEVISKNAHPFVKTKDDHSIVLVHNGYISNHKELDADVSVDSEAIGTALLDAKTPAEALEKLSGAWAIVWYDHKHRKLYASHNTQRPLAVAQSEQVLYMASESDMLRWILSRHKLNATVLELKENILFEFNLNPWEMRGTELKTKVWVPVSYHSSRAQARHGIEGDMSCWPWVDFASDASNEPDAEFELESPKAPEDAADTELTLLAKQAAEAAAKDFDETHMSALQKLYPSESTVLFKPNDYRVTEHVTFVSGTVWTPGKPPKKGRVAYAKNLGDVHWMFQAHVPLVAKVVALMRKNRDAWFQLEQVRIPITLKAINGVSLGQEEWHAICEHYGCNSCAVAPQKHQVEFCEVTRRNEYDYVVTCADCVNAITEGKKVVSQ